ncbi:MAG TPA: outer membrane beta-barrel protein [Acidobacteriota bacterium]|jgi:opacity protein-like surface antigen|nr:porin family protein [Acidobacteriota bacterium]HNR39039.1 outer membrane beta-barrel protein [Acidobacteriota bacterium]HNT99379.1 outer membrane beta-barrel protein [Acidobacteriota bacterium]HPB29306.1 outer membrane beta-barrel protein [Acidobacteriota bacterium]HQO25630.1 outer membrane beta-barrel protein [Acidobacteriota bacterium]
MNRLILLMAASLILLPAIATDAAAQRYGQSSTAGALEITPFFGYSFSSGIDVANDFGELFVEEVNPVSGYSWGVAGDVFLGRNRNFGIGFQYAQQDSGLELNFAGGGKEEIASMQVRNYHATFTAQFLDNDSKVRPFIFGGIGATQFAPGDYQGTEIDGETKFSTTWGGGVKVFFSEHIGTRLMARWTPTYIYSESEGIWCHPYWGCWEYGDAKYVHQFELSAGLILRF